MILKLIILLFVTSHFEASAEDTKIIFEESFEGQSLDQFVFANSGGKQWPVLSTNFSRKGNFSVKFRLDRREHESSFRNEMVFKKLGHRKDYNYDEYGKEYWYGFSIYMPTDWVLDTHPEIIAQWHGVPSDGRYPKFVSDWGEGWRNPNLAIVVRGNKLILQKKWDSKKITPPPGTTNRYDGEEYFRLGDIDEFLGQWTDWILHVKWHYKKGNGAFTKLYRNGRLIYDKDGPNSYNDELGPFFRFGLYKWDWKVTLIDNPSNTLSRKIYYDEIRIGNSKADFSSVSPR